MARRSRIKGAARLRNTLRKISVEVTQGITDAIAEAGAQIANEARNNAPKQSGRLKESIRYAISKDGMAARVGSFGGKTQRAYHAALVEFGTAPGRRKGVNGWYYNHPGSEARPWLLPAWERYKRGAFAKIKAETVKALDATARGHGNPANE